MSADDLDIRCHDCREDNERMAIAIDIDQLAPMEINDTCTCAGNRCDHSQRGWWWFYLFPIDREGQ